MYQPASSSAEAYGAVNVRRRGEAAPTAAYGSSSQTPSSAPGGGSSGGAGALYHRPAYATTTAAAAPSAGAANPYQQPQQQAGYPSGGMHSYTGATNPGGTATAAYPNPVHLQQHPAGATTASAAPASPTIPKYKHNRSTAVALLPPLLVLLLCHPSPYPFLAMLILTLVLYALDLANMRDGTAMAIWIAFAIESLTMLSGILDGGWRTLATRVSCSLLLLFCLACWETLQFQWLHKDLDSFAVGMERVLHLVLPLASSSVLTYHAGIMVGNIFGMDANRTAAACSLLFAGYLAILLSAHAAVDSSFKTEEAAANGAENYNDLTAASGYAQDVNGTYDDGGSYKSKRNKPSEKPRAITAFDGTILSSLLIVSPLFVYAMYGRKLLDDGLMLLLVSTAPYVMHYMLAVSKRIWWASSLPWILRTGTESTTLRGALVPIVISTLAWFAFQFKFIHPICTTASFVLNGHEQQSSVVTTLYLALSSLGGIAGLWFYGRTDQNNELLLGEYHEDAFQGMLAFSGTFLGLALGMQWTLLPLPALCFLAIAIYVSTRMFRYYAVLLFVIFTVFSFFVQYRFLYIQETVDLFFGSMTLTRFGMVGLCTGLMVLCVVGLVFRWSEGWGNEQLKRFDVAGIVLCVYAFSLIPIEGILLKSFKGASMGDQVETINLFGTYKPSMAIMTSGILICVGWHLKRAKCTKSLTTLATLSAASGKMLSVIIDIASSNSGKGESTLLVFTIRALAGAFLLIALFGPSSFFTPASQGRFRAKRSLGPSGKPAELPSDRTNMIVLGYCGVVLPTVIFMCIPLILVPLISGLRSGRLYYSSSPPMSEIIGFASCLWGIATLSTTNYLFPEGGADIWRKAAALMFSLGLGMFFVAPSLPWTSADPNFSDEFASISSAGLDLNQGRTGGFGVLSASLATLLALTGPLELRERRGQSGGKDRTHILRLMIFSILFGCGVAWFVGIQSMAGEPFLALFLTITACMATAFLGTVSCVLGYCVESQNFDEVQQIAKFWMGTSPIFILVAGISTTAKDASPPFGLGGWLSTYMVVFGLTALAFTIAVNIRSDKTSITRALGNLTCILSWLLAIICIYGQFGLAGIGVVSGSVFGIPVSILGTFAAAPILLLLEGEAGDTASNRRTYNLAGSGKRSLPTFGLIFQSLGRANRVSPALAGTVLVLLIASLHAILLRGCAWLAMPGSGQDGQMNKDVFSNVYAFLSKVTGEKINTARTNVFKSKAVASAAKLASAGIWTSQSFTGPFLHLAGVAAVVPSLYILVSNSWSKETKQQSSGRILSLLPLNVIPLVLCRGLPTLWAAALVAIIGGIMQSVSSRQQNYVSHMRM